MSAVCDDLSYNPFDKQICRVELDSCKFIIRYTFYEQVCRATGFVPFTVNYEVHELKYKTNNLNLLLWPLIISERIPNKALEQLTPTGLCLLAGKYLRTQVPLPRGMKKLSSADYKYLPS